MDLAEKCELYRKAFVIALSLLRIEENKVSPVEGILIEMAGGNIPCDLNVDDAMRLALVAAAKDATPR